MGRARATGFELGKVPLTGGCSDGNFTAAFGVPTLNGLGAEGDGAHTLHEYIVVSTLQLRLNFLHGLLRDLAWDAAVTSRVGTRALHIGVGARDPITS